MKKITPYIFPIIFFTILLLPLIFANRIPGAVSKTENRVLAEPAQLFIDENTLNENYFQDVSAWFDDNLGFRDTILRTEGSIRYNIFHEINKMPLGPNGELAPYAYLSDYQHKNLYSDEKLEKVVDSYRFIEDYLEDQGIQVYYMQCWDKHSIYPEQYKDNIEIFGNTSLSDQVENALIENNVMDVIPIKQKFLSLKDTYNLYGTWAEPWHWVDRGAFVAYQELITELNNKNDGKYKVLTEDDFYIQIQDVGETFYDSLHCIDAEEVFSLRSQKSKICSEYMTYIPEGGQSIHATYRVNNAVDNDDTILILGDSYFLNYGVYNYLAESFHTAISFNATGAENGQLVKIISTYRPDIVVFENAERCNYRYDEAVGTAAAMKQRLYDPGDQILFYSDEANSDNYMVTGFSGREETFTWTDGKEASLFFYAPYLAGKNVTASLEFSDVYNGNQQIKIMTNNEYVFDSTYTEGGTINFSFTVPESGMVSIYIELPDACSPFSVGTSNDDRNLGLQIRSFEMCEK